MDYKRGQLIISLVGAIVISLDSGLVGGICAFILFLLMDIFVFNTFE